MQEPKPLRLRIYKCKTHKMDKAFDVHDLEVLAEVLDTKGSLSSIVFEHGKMAYDFLLLTDIWQRYTKGGQNTPDVPKGRQLRVELDYLCIGNAITTSLFQMIFLKCSINPR